MKIRMLMSAGLLVLVALAGAAVGGTLSDKCQSDYDILNQDLLNNTGEVAEISNFVYQKDVATFTLTQGTIHLQRYVDNRPTTAIFFGTGHASINVPTHAGRQGLRAVARDSVVEEDFEILFIRMGDDFDLKLKEQFTFTQETLDWKQLTKAKSEAQGEFFFKPNIEHPYDNYFRLLISLHERKDDGFFWADFNRYVFMFDPNWPEEVTIAYEFEPADLVPTTAARFQRQEKERYEDTLLSVIDYPTTALSKTAQIELSGQDGRRIDQAEATIDLLVNADSLKCAWFYLQFNLKADSVYYDGKPANFQRRKDFEYIGLALPEYRYKGDTLRLTVWYKGTNFDHFLPFVNNPAPCPQTLTFTVPDNYEYFMTGMGPVEKIGGGKARFTAATPAPFNRFYFHCYPTGIENVLPELTDGGLTLNYLVADRDIRRQACFIKPDKYRTAITGAFNTLAARFGQPPYVFAATVIPKGFLSMPGIIKVPQQACVTEGAWVRWGGFDLLAANGVAFQWFGAMMRPRSDREMWTYEALPAYMAILALQTQLTPQHYFDNLFERRDSIYTNLDIGQDMTLAGGRRVNTYADENAKVKHYESIITNRGVWLIHMLRFLMYDIETGTEGAFTGFLRDLYLLVNNKSFTNTDIQRIAEKHAGQDLDWFFRQWMYNVYIPKFDVSWSIAERGGKYFIPVDVRTADVLPDFTMPVAVRVVRADGTFDFERPTVTGTGSSFELGPYDEKPNDFVFNEFMSVLSRDNVSKK